MREVVLVKGFASNRRGRRRGQALLLAVLLMIIAALLGSTFVFLLSANVSRSAAPPGARLTSVQTSQTISRD